MRRISGGGVFYFLHRNNFQTITFLIICAKYKFSVQFLLEQYRIIRVRYIFYDGIEREGGIRPIISVSVYQKFTQSYTSYNERVQQLLCTRTNLL